MPSEALYCSTLAPPSGCRRRTAPSSHRTQQGRPSACGRGRMGGRGAGHPCGGLMPSTSASQTPNPAFRTTKNSCPKKSAKHSGSTPTPSLGQARARAKGGGGGHCTRKSPQEGVDLCRYVVFRRLCARVGARPCHFGSRRRCALGPSTALDFMGLPMQNACSGNECFQDGVMSVYFVL